MNLNNKEARRRTLAYLNRCPKCKSADLTFPWQRGTLPDCWHCHSCGENFGTPSVPEQRYIDAAWAIGSDLMAANYLDMPIECCVPIIAKTLRYISWDASAGPNMTIYKCTECGESETPCKHFQAEDD